MITSSSALPHTARTAATENFPVGSWLLPAELRPVVTAYYRVARAADDIADDPALEPDEKLRRLDAIDATLAGTAEEDSDAAALRAMFRERGLTIEHARHLLQAFKADAGNRPCRSWSDLLAYCRFSAAPVGRFLLELHGEGRATWPAADALCAALQVLNHIQDCQEDWRRLRRLYIPGDWLAEAELTPDALLAPAAGRALRAVLDRMLDGVDRLNLTAASLPSQVANRPLRMEATAIVLLSRRLAGRLRARDPLARHVAISPLDKAVALVWGAIRGWHR